MMEKTTTTTTLPSVLTYLLSGHDSSSPFFPHVIRALIREEVYGLGTAGVTVTAEGRLVLMYDPDTLATLSVKDIKTILIHEVYHIVLHHIPRTIRLFDALSECSDLEKRKFYAISNIACDYAVNSLMVSNGDCKVDDIKNMGEKDPETGKYSFGGVYPSDCGLPPKQAYEWYFNQLMSDADGAFQNLFQFMAECGTLPGGMEGGSGDGMSDEELTELLEQYRKAHSPTAQDTEMRKQIEEMSGDQLKAAVSRSERDSRNAVSHAKEQTKKGRGTLPGSLKEAIDDMLSTPTVPWQRLLKQWLLNTLRTRRNRSSRRPKRRLLEDPDACTYPGRVREKVYTLIFAIDTSGSMSAGDLKDSISELVGIQKAAPGVEIRVIECDAAIGREYDIDEFTPPERTFTGRGGTSFEPVFRRAAELRADAVIYATDGYAPLPPVELLRIRPLVWLITKGGQPPVPQNNEKGHSYGHVVQIQ